MRSQSLQSLLSLSTLLSVAAADVLPRDGAGYVTGRPKVVTVLVHETVTTCPSQPPPPPCSLDITTTLTISKTQTFTVTSKSAGGGGGGGGGGGDHGSWSWSASKSTSTGSGTLSKSSSSSKVWPSSSGWPSDWSSDWSSGWSTKTTSKSTGTSTTASTSKSSAWTDSSSSAGVSSSSSAKPSTWSSSVSKSVTVSVSESASSSSEWSGSTSATSSYGSSSSAGSSASPSSTYPSSSSVVSSSKYSSSSSWVSTSTSSYISSSKTSNTSTTSSSSTSSSTTASSTTPPAPACTDFWLGAIKHQGLAPHTTNGGSDYKVFRNVKEYGAKGDGVTDDTDAINKAIKEGGRCGPGCTGSTTTPALVYFPPGTYLVSKPIVQYYYTQIIGNPSCLPVIKATSDFEKGAPWVFDSNPYGNDGHLAWGATNVFFRQVTNLIFDLTAVPANRALAAVHWPSSQATSLSNIVFKLSEASNTKHQGLFIEEGSGGYVGDLVFYGGAQALSVGNQQFTMRNLTIHNAKTAVQQLWSWGWTYQGVSINNCSVGFDFTAVGETSPTDKTLELKVASAVIFDSEIKNTNVGIVYGDKTIKTPESANSFAIENLKIFNVKDAVKGPSGTIVDGSTGAKTITWARNKEGASVFSTPSRPASLLTGTDYYARSKPQYANLPVTSFLSARDAGLKGDGVADDTQKLNALLATAAASGKVVFLDAGYYRVTSTVKIPSGSRITGEAFPIILSSGAFFADESNPKPVVQIGGPGESGSIEWSNTIVSTKGAQAGAILIEYNLAAPTSAPSGLWDVHVRIGGFAGSDLQLAQCAKTPEKQVTAENIPKECISGFLSFHVTKQSSGLLMENCWIWVADHDLEDGANNQQISVFVGRGLLIESEKGGIWLYGTGVEHHQLYEYQLVGTKAIVMGQIQTETAYYQKNPGANIPFKAVEKYHDPVLTASESGWGLRVVDSKEVFVYGAGLYSFFDNYDLGCSAINSQARCQDRVFSIERSKVLVYNLNTIGVQWMLTKDGQDVGDFGTRRSGFASTIGMVNYL